MWKYFIGHLLHCIKYARIRVSPDPYFPVYGHNRRFSPHTGKYGSVKTRILVYFTQFNHEHQINKKIFFIPNTIIWQS